MTTGQNQENQLSDADKQRQAERAADARAFLAEENKMRAEQAQVEAWAAIPRMSRNEFESFKRSAFAASEKAREQATKQATKKEAE